MGTLTRAQADELHDLFTAAREAAWADGRCTFGIGWQVQDRVRGEYHAAWQAFIDALYAGVDA